MTDPLSRRRALRDLGLFLAGAPFAHAQFSPRAAHPRVPSLEVWDLRPSNPD